MTRFQLLRSLLLACSTSALMLAGAGSVHAQQYDPSYDAPQATYPATTQELGRVARLAYLSGQVQLAPAGEDDSWGSVEINRPMVLGDRLLTGDDGLAALELGDASVRVGNDSALDFLNLSEDNVQIELSQGTLNLAVQQMGYGHNFEVDTPTLAFVASTPGTYRIDNDPDGHGSMVTVFRGAGVVYGENGASRDVSAGQSYRFNDSSLTDVAVDGLPQPDDFDRFCESRDDNRARYASQQQQYVPPDMIGGDQLYQYGRWDSAPEYGNVWYPNSVPTGWAPYRSGHWAWIQPWGWTWIDDQPWGFAPFHYGRWVYISNRWGWLPGPVNVRPVYAPALVAFIGGSGLSISVRIGGGGPVGWFPLGPRDVYVPWFHSSRRYFDRVNVTNIRNVYVNQTVINNIYNDYSHNRYNNVHRYNRYAYRNMQGAVTAVPHNVFTGARPVRPAVLRLTRNQLKNVRATVRPDVAPDKSSLGLRQPDRRIANVRANRPFVRPVVARHEPAPRPVSFSASEKVIANQHGRPLTRAQVQDLRKARPDTQTHAEKRVRLVPARPGEPAGVAAVGAPRREAPVSRPTTPSGKLSTQPFRNTVHPIPARRQPNVPEREPRQLPSTRFAHPDEPRHLPKAPVIRPAGSTTPERLPVVRPIERAPGTTPNDAVQPRREANRDARERVQVQPQRQVQVDAQQRDREQQAQRQQQRQAQMQVQQRAREQQVQQQQQRQVQLQAQQRAREQQAQQQQQRQAQMQAQQRVREQQVQQQQQRQVQMQAQQRAREQQVQQQQQRQAQMQEQQRAREQQMQVRQAQQAQRESRQRASEQAVQRRAPEPREEPRSKKHPDDNSGNRRMH